MFIQERTAGDLQRLLRLARREKRAEQKDRLMAAKLANQKHETVDIQISLRRGRGFVQRWAYAYSDGEIEALKDKPRGESVAKDQQRDRLEAQDPLRCGLDPGKPRVRRLTRPAGHLCPSVAKTHARTSSLRLCLPLALARE